MPAEHPFASAYSQHLMCITEGWRDALARLEDGLGARERIVLVTGVAGTGKTALVSEATTRWGAKAHVTCVTNPTLTRLELIEEIARRLGAEPPVGASKPQLLGCLDARLAEVAKRSQVAVIVIEDAHQLADDAFDELRLLVNSEAQAKRSLELVFVGLPVLEDRLATPALLGLGQRVTGHCRLEPLSNKGTRRYVSHRVQAVGGDPATLFPRQSCTELHALSQGVPRTINTLASEAMRLAHEAKLASVTPELLRTAAGEPAAPVAIKPANPTAAEPDRDAAQTELVAPADPEARVSEWVSRFVGSQGPPRIGSALSFGEAGGSEFEAESLARQARMSEPEAPEIAARSRETESLPGDPDPGATTTTPGATKKPMRLIVLDDLPEDIPAARATRGPMPRVRHRSANGVTGPVIAGSVFVLAAVATVMLLNRGQGRLPGGTPGAVTGASQTTSNAAPPIAFESSAPIIEPVRNVPVATAPIASPSIATAPVAPPADSIVAKPPKQRLALDVGSFIDPDRARLERDHLIAQTGLRAWVVDDAEDGGAIYRVVLGVFTSQERADASANSLLGQGLISEARVVPVPSRRSRH